MSKEVANDHDEIASDRNAKYRSGYTKLLSLLVGLILLMVVLTPMFLLVTFMPTSPRYYATTTHGEIYPMSSLSEPVVTDTYLRQWVSAIAGGIFTVSFNDWQTQLDKYKADFTDLAWQDLLDAYKNDGFANTLVQNQLIASAVVSQTPKILNRSIINGRYTWSVMVPVLINYTSASANAKQTVDLSLTISRVPVLSSSQGIQISNLHAHLVTQGGS